MSDLRSSTEPGFTRSGISTSALGTLAELRAIAHLLELGHRVAVPVVDEDGVDLIVNYRTTVQVKAAGSLSLPVRRGKVYDGNYIFGLKGKMRADVLLCHAIPDDAWWIIPRDELGDVARITSLGLCSEPRYSNTRASRLAAWRDAWHVFDSHPTSTAGFGPGEEFA